jgi:hypothetical protein
MGRLVLQVQASDSLQRLTHPLPDPLRLQSKIKGAKGHIIKDRGHEELVIRVLEYQSHFFPDLLPRPLVQLEITNCNGAALRQQVAVCMHKKR